MSNHDIVMTLALSCIAGLIYEHLVKPQTFRASSVGTPNAIAVPTTQPLPSVSSGSSVLTTAQTGTNLFAGSGLGNNPVPVPTHELMGPDQL